MDQQNRIGAGRTIFIAAMFALLLLWIDGWSHSMPMMFVTAAMALIVFVGFRPGEPVRQLTHSERVEMEREAALSWTRRNPD